MEITFFDSAKDTAADPSNTTTWEEFVDFCQLAFSIEHHRSDKLLAPAFIAGRCEEKRANSNVRFLSLIAADFDIGPDDPRYKTFDQMVEFLDHHGYAFVIYTTTSNTVAHQRYRVVMPLARDVDPAHWLSVWNAANAKFDAAFDPATKDPARLSFLPARWIGNPFQCARKGEVLLERPFNALDARMDGKPILSEIELTECETAAPVSVHNRPVRSPTPCKKNPAPQAKPSALLMNSRIRNFLTSTQGPLVAHWMRARLPHEEGSRTYRFMQAAAFKAQDDGTDIDADLLVELTTNWLLEFRNAAPARDIYRQAENALLYVQQNPNTER